MAGLYLHCVICARKQADGLISGAAWGRLELTVEQRGNGAGAAATVRVCPTCVSTHTDWQTVAVSGLRKAS